MASQKKKQRSLLQMQRDKLKKQKLAKKNQETIARGIKKMLFDKDGEIKKVESTKDALNRNRRGRVRSTRAAVGSKGSGTKSGTPKKLPPGNKGGALAKKKPQLTGNTVKGLLKGAGSNANKVLRFGTRLLAGRDDGSGSALLAAKMTSDAIDAARGSTAEERNAGKTKPKKTKRQVTSRNRRGRPTSYAAPVKPAKRGLSNIPPEEGTGGKAETTLKYGAGKPEKSTVKGSTPGGGSKGATGASSPKSRAYSKDARNKEYDRLRKAGKTKEAEALGKKIAADARKKAPKNPFRAPQGAERKDRMSKVVKELKAMRKKKPQSKANKKGWPGNKNY